jgi:hypothetical protein
MLSFSEKVSYLIDSAFRILEPKKCPFCGSTNNNVVDRKYIVTTLLECNNCKLNFRHPVEIEDKSNKFYQKDYIEKDSITASLPTDSELQEYKATQFSHGNKNADRYIRIFKELYGNNTGIKIIDYGSSWGYISYQIKQHYQQVESFEISVPRAKYGIEKLGLNIRTNAEELAGGNDIFFSSHVIEHLPDIKYMLELAKRKLNGNGYFIAICPNGSSVYREKNPEAFHHTWGKVHPNFITADFYRTVFKNNPYYIGSSPFNFGAIGKITGTTQIVDNLLGEELIVVTKINQSLTPTG